MCNYFEYSVIITDGTDGQSYENKTQVVINCGACFNFQQAT